MLQFGFEMGTGVRTFAQSPLPHIVTLAIMLPPGLTEALLAGVGFAPGRLLTAVDMPAVASERKWERHLAFLIARPAQLSAGLRISIVLVAVS
jgi:hypothetical protein